MATFKEIADCLNKVVQRLDELPSDLEELLVTQQAAVALNFYAVIKNRIQQTGEKAEGGQLGEYSTSPSLVGSTSFRTKTAANKVLGSKSKRKARQWRTVKSGNKSVRLTILEGGYKELRDLSGLQTGFVDLTYRDQTSGYEGMWSRIRLIVKEVAPGKILIGLEPDQLDSEGNSLPDRISALNKKYGTNILAPSAQEIQDGVEYLEEVISDLIFETMQPCFD